MYVSQPSAANVKWRAQEPGRCVWSVHRRRGRRRQQSTDMTHVADRAVERGGPTRRVCFEYAFDDHEFAVQVPSFSARERQSNGHRVAVSRARRVGLVPIQRIAIRIDAQKAYQLNESAIHPVRFGNYVAHADGDWFCVSRRTCERAERKCRRKDHAQCMGGGR